MAVCQPGENSLPTCAEFVALNNSESNRIHEQFDQLVTRWNPDSCVVAGSNGESRETLVRFVSNTMPEPLVLRAFKQLPLTVNVDTPETVGIDRLLNALGAKILSPKGTAILVDSGTATTVDLVQDGTFEGGAILPGLRLGAMSLHDYTDALPLVDTGRLALEAIRVPGKNTEAAIATGILLGQVGAIREIVSHYQQAAGDAELVLTGGAADRLHSAFPDAIIRPYLSLRAMAALAVK